MRERTSFSPRDRRSMPSSAIEPWYGSTSLKRETIRLDLPLPVRPTMPTFSPGATKNVTPGREYAAGW